MTRSPLSTRPPLLAIVVALTLLAAACGGSDDEKAAQQPAGSDQPLKVALVPNQEPDKVKAQYSRSATTWSRSSECRSSWRCPPGTRRWSRRWQTTASTWPCSVD